jgi:hypothetical protein
MTSTSDASIYLKREAIPSVIFSQWIGFNRISSRADFRSVLKFPAHNNDPVVLETTGIFAVYDAHVSGDVDLRIRSTSAPLNRCGAW